MSEPLIGRAMKTQITATGVALHYSKGVVLLSAQQAEQNPVSLSAARTAFCFNGRFFAIVTK
ncbi:hypothetical protein BN440_2818 [Erwinia amylovora MR1]|nr:hypothetical protein BN440_2818 [Erwinia amylovora MR1]